MKAKVALGFGNNVDYEIVWNAKIFEKLIVRYNIRDEELDISRTIESVRDFVISILAFVKLGIGGERFVSSSQVIEEFSQHFEKKITLGGTSVRAAIVLRKFGFKSALHLVTINEHVRRLIPHDSDYVCSNTEDSSYPHLIVQFDKDTRIQANNIRILAGQSNRLIYHSDDDNIRMNLNEDFSELITDVKVLMVSGFNAMQSEELLHNRLKSILRIMESLPEDVLVYYEDAGFYNPQFSHLIHRVLAKKIDIFALNEDELQAYLHRKLDLLDVVQVSDALVDIHSQMPVPTIVVHTRYWAIAYGNRATHYSEALRTATALATTRFCYGDDFTIQQYEEIEQLPPARENASFANVINKPGADNIYCVPVVQVETVRRDYGWFG